MGRSFLIALLAGMALPAMGQSPKEGEPRQPNTFTLTIKTGDLRLADDSQTISGNDRVFDKPATIFAIEAEGRLPREAENVSLGGEVIRYSNLFKRASFVGGFEDKMYTHAFLAKTKYYFRSGRAVQPYLGGGIGTAWVQDFTGPIHGFAEGLAYQGVLGLLLRADRFGMRVEYMVLRARVPDDNGERIDASSRGVFVGLSFFFGRT
jgi:opacity protein-like surface antigen